MAKHTDWKVTAERLRVAGIELAIVVKKASWSLEDLVESGVKHDAEKGIESVKKFISK